MNRILTQFFLFEFARKGPKETYAQFFKILYLGQKSANAKKQDGQLSTLNGHKEIKGKIILCKTLLHSA